MFLDELVEELRSGRSSNPEISKTATQHGHDLLRQGFTASQVVHDYGDVCQAITEIASESNVTLSTDDVRTLDRCLDDAIAAAVTQYARERDQPGDGNAAGETERLGVLATELRNSIFSAGGALEVMKSATVGIVGSTWRALDRSLSAAHGLIGHLLVEIYDAAAVEAERLAVLAAEPRHELLTDTAIAKLALYSERRVGGNHVRDSRNRPQLQDTASDRRRQVHDLEPDATAMLLRRHPSAA